MMNAVINGAAMVERAEKERDAIRTELSALRAAAEKEHSELLAVVYAAEELRQGRITQDDFFAVLTVALTPTNFAALSADIASGNVVDVRTDESNS